MKIYQFKDYDEYVRVQTEVNRKKIMWVYAREEVIKQIVDRKPKAKAVICHGTRNGAEQKFFKKFLPDAMVIGTEISDTAEQFPMTVRHDFTMENDEWKKKFDIVYSNSFDHSIDPPKTLQTWKGQLKRGGQIFLEYAELQSVCLPSDPLEASYKEVEKLIEEAGLTVSDKILKGVKHGGVVYVCEVATNDKLEG